MESNDLSFNVVENSENIFYGNNVNNLNYLNTKNTKKSLLIDASGNIEFKINASSDNFKVNIESQLRENSNWKGDNTLANYYILFQIQDSKTNTFLNDIIIAINLIIFITGRI